MNMRMLNEEERRKGRGERETRIEGLFRKRKRGKKRKEEIKKKNRKKNRTLMSLLG